MNYKNGEEWNGENRRRNSMSPESWCRWCWPPPQTARPRTLAWATCATSTTNCLRWSMCRNAVRSEGATTSRAMPEGSKNSTSWNGAQRRGCKPLRNSPSSPSRWRTLKVPTRPPWCKHNLLPNTSRRGEGRAGPRKRTRSQSLVRSWPSSLALNEEPEHTTNRPDHPLQGPGSYSGSRTTEADSPLSY